jgi:hypothetical protein
MPLLSHLEGLLGLAQVGHGLVNVGSVVADKTVDQVVERALQLRVLG